MNHARAEFFSLSSNIHGVDLEDFDVESFFHRSLDLVLGGAARNLKCITTPLLEECAFFRDYWPSNYIKYLHRLVFLSRSI